MITSRNPDISIVMPAFNEAERLPPYLAEVIRFADRNDKKYEIIIVDDGSRDKTAEKIAPLIKGRPGIKLIRLKANRGKGYAVKKGLYASRGKIRAFMDADGSFGPDQIEKNISSFDRGYHLVIGSRLKRPGGGKIQIAWWRMGIGRFFNIAVRLVLGLPFLDTQCGFKMIRGDVVKPLFAKMRVRRFGFDFELLYLAHRFGLKIAEVPIRWTHKSGSKVNWFLDPFDMLANIFRVKKVHKATVISFTSL